jgi:alkyl sulfatase BDS1-like metallo-beta-lactamase superfamily hydrolase
MHRSFCKYIHDQTVCLIKADYMVFESAATVKLRQP